MYKERRRRIEKAIQVIKEGERKERGERERGEKGREEGEEGERRGGRRGESRGERRGEVRKVERLGGERNR